LGREYVYPAQAQTLSDGARDVNVHVEFDAQGSFPIARSRLRTGESPACALRASTC
jgi:hypothetical protein